MIERRFETTGENETVTGYATKRQSENNCSVDFTCRNHTPPPYEVPTTDAAMKFLFPLKTKVETNSFKI